MDKPTIGKPRPLSVALPSILLLAAWFICSLVFPSALWEAYAHDAGRYLLLSLNGDFLPAAIPLLVLCAALLVAIALVVPRCFGLAPFRRALPVLSAAAATAGIAVSWLGAGLLSIGPFAFAFVVAAVYVWHGEAEVRVQNYRERCD